MFFFALPVPETTTQSFRTTINAIDPSLFPRYGGGMRIDDFFIVFPEGDVQEISGRLRINALVDLNGSPLRLPLSDPHIIAFRVDRVSTKEGRGGSETYHYLSLVSAAELSAYARR